jgi:hypothetical protein
VLMPPLRHERSEVAEKVTFGEICLGRAETRNSSHPVPMRGQTSESQDDMSDLFGTIATTVSTILGTLVCLVGTSLLFKLMGTCGPWVEPVGGGDAPTAGMIAPEAPPVAMEALSPATSSSEEEDFASTVLTKVTAALR